MTREGASQESGKATVASRPRRDLFGLCRVGRHALQKHRKEKVMSGGLHKGLTVRMLGRFPALASAQRGREQAPNHVTKHARSRLRSRRRFGILHTLALALAAVAYTSAVQAQVKPKHTWPEPYESGYVVYVVTNDQNGAGTDATILVSLTFFAPGYHQMYWDLDNPDTNDLERGALDTFFFEDAYIAAQNNNPYLSLRSKSPDWWLWDCIYVIAVEGGQLNESKAWLWTNTQDEWITGPPADGAWHYFGRGTHPDPTQIAHASCP
jgi:hypothetical protein